MENAVHDDWKDELRELPKARVVKCSAHFYKRAGLIGLSLAVEWERLLEVETGFLQGLLECQDI